MVGEDPDPTQDSPQFGLFDGQGLLDASQDVCCLDVATGHATVTCTVVSPKTKRQKDIIDERVGYTYRIVWVVILGNVELNHCTFNRSKQCRRGDRACRG